MIDWSPVRVLPNEPSSLAVIDKEEQVQEPMDVDLIERSGPAKEELEGIREDGELPSLLPNMSAIGEIKPNSSKGSSFVHSKQLSLISKSISPSLNKVKSQSFKKYDENSDFLLDLESDLDELAQIEADCENIASDQCFKRSDLLWMDYGVKVFCLVLSAQNRAEEKNVKLEAKVYECSFLELLFMD